ncbi:MAG: DUF971 domain-containing protein [Planctomycetota bacterium]
MGRPTVEITPTGLERTENGLRFLWSDGHSCEFSARMLRDACPCAVCGEKQSAAETAPMQALPVLSMAETAPLRIQGMQPVGNYAYNIVFSDGHDSGIYTIKYLLNLREESASK